MHFQDAMIAINTILVINFKFIQLCAYSINSDKGLEIA